MKLEHVDPLVGERTQPGQQLVARTLESEEARRIGTEAEVNADGSHGCAVADAEAGAMHHIVEILEIPLAEAETQVPYVGIDVSHVVKQYTAYIVADQRKTQLRR